MDTPRRVRIIAACLASLLGACVAPDPVEPWMTASVSGPKLTAPSNLSAVAASERRIDLSWQDNSNETGFEVHRSTTGAAGSFVLLTTILGDVASYGDAGLSASTQFCYKVRAFRRYDGKTSSSAFSNTACATTPSPPAPPPPPPAPPRPYPANAKPQNSTTIDVLWWTDTYPDGFRVERSFDVGETWTAAGTAGRYARSFSDPGRTSEQKACYRVFAFNLGGDSPPSNTSCTTPPAAPSGLTATAIDGPTIDVTWSDNSALEESYAVERSTDGVAFSLLATVYANNAYHDGAVSSNATYWYRVRAKKDGGFSDFSNVASATAGSVVPPLPPVSLNAGNLIQYGLSNVLLDWRAGSYNQDGFKVERCLGVLCSDPDFMLIATLGAISTWHVDINVQPGSTYTYRVRAFNSAGDSAPSPEASGTACYVDIDPFDGFYTCFPPL